MIRGRLGAALEPLVPIVLHGRTESAIEALVDTGFSDYVCLARRHRRRLTLVPAGSELYELADGTLVREPVYEASVTFDGARQPVLVTISRSWDTLIGMALLRGKRLEVNVRRGTVVIDEG